MRDRNEEARRWLSQAANDLQFAEVAFREEYFSQCCFISQQAAEKAVKAVHYHRGARIVIGHSIFKLLTSIPEEMPALLIELAKILDQFYIASRYPNGIPGGAPFEVFTRRQASEALSGAQQIFRWAENEVSK